MRIIAVLNHKGGVGKTTSTLNIGAGLSRLGHSVLLVDLDPQSHLTYSLGVAAHQVEQGVYGAMMGRADPEGALVPVEGMDLFPSSPELTGAEVGLAAHPDREHALSRVVERLMPRDYLLVDCPPNLGLLTVAAMTAAREVFIPMQSEYLALQSLSKLVETVDVVRERLNAAIRISGIFLTRFHKRKRLDREVAQTLRKHFPDQLMESAIRENIQLAESPSFGRSIFEYAPSSNGALDYLNLSREIAGRAER